MKVCISGHLHVNSLLARQSCIQVVRSSAPTRALVCPSNEEEGTLRQRCQDGKITSLIPPSFFKHDYRLKAPGLVASGLKTNLFSIHREHWELWGWQGPCANNNDNLILKEGYLIKLTIKEDHIHDLVYLLQMWRRWHKVQSHSWRICDEDGGDGDDDDNDDDFKDDQYSGQDNNLRVYLQAERRRQEERQDPIERTPGWR